MKNLLLTIPYSELYPPQNGGMLRCFHLMRQFARFYKVTIITKQSSQSLSAAFANYPGLSGVKIISIPSGNVENGVIGLMPKALRSSVQYRLWNRSIKGPADSTYLDFYRPLKTILKNKKFDFVVLENLSLVPLANMVRRVQPGAYIIYDAHNVDSTLVNSLPGITPQVKARIFELESKLADMTDLVLTCSSDDLQSFKAINKMPLNAQVVPNGVEIFPDIAAVPKKQKSIADILFIGSLDYPPNTEGLSWFCREVVPLLRTTHKFNIKVVGKGKLSQSLEQDLMAADAVFAGRVEDVNPYYENATVAVVPILSGSGTRLKLLEAMGRRTAVVSTSKGAEGIEYSDGKDIMIGDTATEFAKKISMLLENSDLTEIIAANAFFLAKEKYDWNKVGEKIFQYLERVTQKNSGIKL